MDVEPAIIEQIERYSPPPSDRAKQLAAALINVPRVPVGFGEAAKLASESASYYGCQPYPWHHFTDWKTEERGPFPRCMPIVRTGVDRGARWLFGKPVQLTIPKNKTLEEWVRKMWTANRMHTRMAPLATKGGIQGGCALKFSYDANSDPPLCIQTLSTTQHVRCFYDPLDRERLLMTRIQFNYTDPVDGNEYFHREEWTAEEEVTYIPVRAMWVPGRTEGRVRWPSYVVVEDGRKDPDAYEGWIIDERKPNAFGLIPVTPIKNADADDSIGLGDYWGLTRVIDRINLTYHLMDRSNQFDSEPLLMFLDAALDPKDLTRSMMPGQPLDLKSDSTDTGENAKGQVVQMEARGSLRPAMMEYARKLERYVDGAAGTVNLDLEEITNKGQMSGPVMHLTYAPLIETTHQKRRTYGEDGIGKFLESAITGLRNAGLRIPELAGVKQDDPESHSVQLVWPRLLPMGEDDKVAAVTRWGTEFQSGTMSHERIIEFTAEIEDVEDVDKLKQELAEVSAAAEEGQKQLVGPQETEPEDAKEDRAHARATTGFKEGVLTRNEARQHIGKPPVKPGG